MGPPVLLPIVLAGVAAMIAVAAAWISAHMARRSWPIGVQELSKSLTERVLAVEANVDGQTARFRELRAEVTGFMEEAEGILEAVERKRRRAAASASNAAKAAEEGHEPTKGDRMAQLRALARARGIAV